MRRRTDTDRLSAAPLSAAEEAALAQASGAAADDGGLHRAPLVRTQADGIALDILAMQTAFADQQDLSPQTNPRRRLLRALEAHITRTLPALSPLETLTQVRLAANAVMHRHPTWRPVTEREIKASRRA